MSELIIKTISNGLDPAYQDGDIIHAMNDLIIHFVHSYKICISSNLDKVEGVWYDRSIAEMFLSAWYQYKTERISKKVVRVTDQWASNSILKSDTPNQYGQVMYVEEFFQRRLASVPWYVFGIPKAEVYYSGGMRYQTAEDTFIWNQIESMTVHRKVNYSSYPKGEESKYQNLVITVDDFDTATRYELELSAYDDKVDPPIMIKKRKNKVNWKDLPGITQQIIDDVNKDDVEVDIRSDFTFTRSQIVEAKAITAEL